MELVRPSTEILYVSNIDLIEQAGRTCYKSENKITNDSAKNFVKMIDERGHHAMLEHSFASVRVICDRGVSHEIVRHRLFSFAQESTRYCNYSKNKFNGVTFVIPSWMYIEPGIYHEKNGTFTSPYGDKPFNEVQELKEQLGALNWLYSCLKAEQNYMFLLDIGWTPQQARSILPNSTKTELVISGNFREWKHFFELRTDSSAHPQMREIAIPLCKEFEKQVPEIKWIDREIQHE